MKNLNILLRLFFYECQWAYQRRSVCYQGALLFSALLLTWPLLTTPLVAQQKTAVLGAMWLMLTLLYASNMMHWFAVDFHAGTLTHLLLSPWPLPLLLSIQVGVYWLANLLPLLAVLPCLGYLLGLSWPAVCGIAGSFVLGTFVLSFASAIMALLVLGLPTAGGLVPILMLPIVVPVLIFGVHQQWIWLVALCALTWGTAPFLMAGALRSAHID